MKQLFFLIITLVAFANYCYPQSKLKEDLHKIIISSKILKQEKEIFIGLPDNYNDSAEYPLIILLEAEVLFETIKPLTKLMGQVNEIPPCIVVGIPLYDRHIEYAPRIKDVPESGNADNMLAFYKDELFPTLDSIYNCSKDKIIWAHSGLGGIFCTYLLLGPDNQFTGIISSSPNLRWMQEYIKREDVFNILKMKRKTFYYLTFGDNEDKAYMGEMFNYIKEFNDKLEKGAPANLIWKYRLYENNNHFTNAIETYIDGLILYFKKMKK